MLKTPTIVVNVKTYAEATGQKAVQLAQHMDKLAQETGASLAIAVQATDLYQCISQVKIPVYAQHIDPITPGSHTGWMLPEAVQDIGAAGTLINHSEHRLKLADIDACLSRARELSLDHIICTNNIATSVATAGLNPDFIAVEPPELIGGDISVTSADPDIVSGTVQEVQSINTNVKVLCGAGVKNGNDVAKALELGSEGVLLASGVVKAKNQEAILRDLINGL